jgi:hypothetical protein
MGLRSLIQKPSAVQRIMWLARAVSAVAFVVGMFLAAQAAAAGNTVGALLFIAISVAYVLATWVSPLSPVPWIAIGGMVAVFVVLDPGVISITLAAAAGVLFWMRGRKRSSSIDTSTLHPVAPDAVMRGAEQRVDELVAMGWRQAGAYGFESLAARVTASVLVHPNLDRHAQITDMLASIESRFDDGRILITLNSGRASLPPNYLTNDLPGASPAELAGDHQRALDLLVTFGVTPLQVPEHTIVSEAMASEVETIQWSTDHVSGGLFNFGTGAGALDGSPKSTARIEAWLADSTEYQVSSNE